MPRTSDHDARREQICAALHRVACRDGLPKVTLPKVAAEAGISVGLVQHYYDSKSLLLTDAHRSATNQIEARIDRAIAEAEARRHRIEHILAEALTQFLPTDGQRRDEWYLARAFQLAAIEDPDLLPALRSGEHHIQSRVRAAIDNGRHCGEVTDDLDAPTEAAALLAKVSGLADRLAWGAMKPDVARRIIAQDCARLFPGPCDRKGTANP